MSRYQTVNVTHQEDDVLTLRVVEVHADMQLIHDMLQHCELGERVEWQGEESSTKVFEVINAAGLLLFSNHIVARTLKDEGPPFADTFIQAVEVVSTNQIGESSSGAPLYEATMKVTMQSKRFADAFHSKPNAGWDGYACIVGEFNQMFF